MQFPRMGITTVIQSGLRHRRQSNECAKRSDVPMTRPGECLAVIDGIGVKNTFTHLPDGRIMACTSGRHYVSSDNGRGVNEEPISPRI
jgi:hypothetical protein